MIGNLDFELNIIEELQNRENMLRFKCNLEPQGLTWNKICEIISPNNPNKAKMNLLKYICDNEVVSDTYGILENKLMSTKDTYFDVTFYHGIVNILDEHFDDRQEDFIDIMVHIHNGIKHLGYPIEEIFWQAWLCFMSRAS